MPSKASAEMPILSQLYTSMAKRLPGQVHDYNRLHKASKIIRASVAICEIKYNDDDI